MERYVGCLTIEHGLSSLPSHMRDHAQRTPSEILDDAIDLAEPQLGGIELRFDRACAEPVFWVGAYCPLCSRGIDLLHITEAAVEDMSSDALVAMLCEYARGARLQCVGGMCVDLMDRFVDGLTVRECLERYTAFQRNERRSILPLLTHAQLTAARSAWSSSLKRMQSERREKERVAVVVERDEDGL